MELARVPLTRSTSSIVVLSSEFLGFLIPLEKEQTAKEEILKLRSLHHDARHICFAYRFHDVERCSDDGEPTHTAGLPLLTLLKDFGADRALLAVVRYFGGTLLGAGRLARSYRKAGEEAMRSARWGQEEPLLRLTLIVPYPEYDRLRRTADRKGLMATPSFLAENIKLSIEGSATILERWEEELSRLFDVVSRETIIGLKEIHDAK